MQDKNVYAKRPHACSTKIENKFATGAYKVCVGLHGFNPTQPPNECITVIKT